jgi:hypothetical protein
LRAECTPGSKRGSLSSPRWAPRVASCEPGSSVRAPGRVGTVVFSGSQRGLSQATCVSGGRPAWRASPQATCLSRGDWRFPVPDVCSRAVLAPPDRETAPRAKRPRYLPV